MSKSEATGEGVYSIGAVAGMLGIRTVTLRNWEDRYGLVTPERSEGGHRLYSRRQIEQLRFLATKVEQGMPSGDAHRLLAERLDEGAGVPLTEPQSEVRLLILLAERDPYSAEFAEYFLKTEGYETLIVLDATDARTRFEELSPKLAIVDLLISGGDGYGLCRTLKGQSNSPVLAVSTLESRDEALDSGADAFLQKPFEPLQLVSTVRDLLGTSAYLRTKLPTS
ncbi:MAG: MerR family transcriptional regulator [Actinobacteria bacterium]|nr:MerR family transcriptional regulator [Actinomycetota bacterium]